MKKSWLFYISPCILAALVCVIGIIMVFAQKESSGGWSFVFAIICLPLLFILLLASVLIKAFTKGKVLHIWILEAIVVAILMIWSNDYYR